MDRMLPSIHIVDKPLLNIISLYLIPLFHYFLDFSLIFLLKLSMVTVVDSRFVEMGFLDTTVLPPIDEALQHWKPPPDVHEHLAESHSLTESIVVSCVGIFVWICWQIHHLVQFLMSLIQLVYILKNLLFGHFFNESKMISKRFVWTNRIRSNGYYSLHPLYVFVVVKTNKRTHDGRSK